VKSAWSDVDIQLKKRYDLVPQMVNIIKGYTKHEESTLNSLTKIRTNAIQAESIKEQEYSENKLSQGLKSIFAVSENYPDLKANQNFMQLQTELTAIEDNIQMARRYYNGSVKEFNNKLETFPNNIFAKILNFETASFFELGNSAERETKNIKF
jgi:LemA protein